MDSDTQRANGAGDGNSPGQSAGNPSPGFGNQSSLADQLRQQASTRLADGKDRAVQGLTSLADAVRQTGRQLREKDQSGIASYIETAADQATRFSERLSNKDFAEIVDDIERFAHRQPALFLGVSFGIGLVGARFLKSSRSNAQRTGRPNFGAAQSSSRPFPASGMTGYGASATPRPRIASTPAPAPATPSSAAGPTPEPAFGTSTRRTDTDDAVRASSEAGGTSGTRTGRRPRSEH